jgi:hypothetical protein
MVSTDEFAVHFHVLLLLPQLIAGGTGRACEQATVAAFVLSGLLQSPLAR